MSNFDSLLADFTFLEDWEERYRYLIDLGKALPDLSVQYQTDTNKISGCASQVWLAWSLEEGRLVFHGTSDAAIVKGLIAILLILYNNKEPADILCIDPEKSLEALDLRGHITPQRANGLTAMIHRIRVVAKKLSDSQ